MAEINVDDIPFAQRTVVVSGIELAYPERRSAYLPRLGSVHSLIFEAGTAFISFALLEELEERDNSLGMGGAFIIDDSRAGWALEQAGLATRETRGGYFTTEEQKIKLRQLIVRYVKYLKAEEQAEG